MWEQLTQIVQTTLEAVPNVKDVFMVPKTKLTKYPAVFFKPAAFQNQWTTRTENEATYRFLAIVIVGVNSNNTLTTAFTSVLPHTVDAIIDQFNEDWDGGTIDGHRVRVKIDSADEWQVSQEQDGIEVYAPLSIEIRLLTTI